MRKIRGMTLSIYVPITEIEEWEKVAHERHLNMSQFIRQVMNDYMSKKQ